MVTFKNMLNECLGQAVNSSSDPRTQWDSDISWLLSLKYFYYSKYPWSSYPFLSNMRVFSIPPPTHTHTHAYPHNLASNFGPRLLRVGKLSNMCVDNVNNFLHSFPLLFISTTFFLSNLVILFVILRTFSSCWRVQFDHFRCSISAFTTLSG